MPATCRSRSTAPGTTISVPSPPIHGVLTPHVVPLDARGEINEPELRRYVDWLIE
jgi:hypothetical protein